MLIEFDVDTIARFFARTRPGPIGPDGEPCLLWTGATLDVNGQPVYGKWSVRIDGRAVTDYAHRIAWMMHTGQPIPAQRSLDHLCRRTLCVRFTHLEPVTGLENNRRRTVARRALRAMKEAS
jgi:hypothetical protein